MTASEAGFGNIVRAFRARNYRIYVAGNAISLIGTWLQRVSVGWLAWELTHSGVWLGLVSFADLFPTVVLSPLAGALADRRDRIWVLRRTQFAGMVQASLLAALTLIGAIEIWSLFLLTLVLGACNAMAQPARLALIPSLVDRDTLPSAVAINSIVFNNARFIGPALAGVVIARGSAWFPGLPHGGTSLAFILNALFYVAFQISLARLDRLVEERQVSSGGRRMLSSTIEGYIYAFRHPGIGPMLVLFMLSSFAARGFIEMMPGFADAVFERGREGLGWLVAVTGLGAMAGGLWMARRPGLDGLTGITVAFTFVLAGALFAFTATTNFWLALVFLFIAGMALVVTGIAAQTLVQSAVDRSMRGRVMGLYGMIFRGGPALNALLIGIFSSGYGLRLPLAVGAGICVLLGFWARWRQRALAHALEFTPATAAAD
ncbi:MAG TPA: MFS transporter [Stellaceae bacterium]|nr:MFS transporter [Stellaceae bacterium]